jgi:hypothetical protein
MDALPFPQKVVTALDDLCGQTSHVCPLDADTEHDLGRIAPPEQVDLRVARAGDVDMSRFVIDRIDDKPKAMGAMDDNHNRS